MIYLTQYGAWWSITPAAFRKLAAQRGSYSLDQTPGVRALARRPRTVWRDEWAPGRLVMGLLLLFLSACDVNAARCTGWCEAHGYEHSMYVETGARMLYSQDECWCALRVPPEVAVVGAPNEAPRPEPLPAEAEPPRVGP